MKKITYKANNETFVIYGEACDALEICALVQNHAIANNINLDDIIVCGCEMVK